MLDTTKLCQALGCPEQRASKWVDALNKACEEFGIDTPARQAAFLAQVGHESGRLMYVRELWGPTPAQARYEGRLDLGNTEKGDGFRFRGRGLIQITGRTNYARCGLALGLPLLEKPELLETPAVAARSAAWFWSVHGLNAMADAGDFEGLTKRINGGTNGYADRLKIFAAAKSAMGA